MGIDAGGTKLLGGVVDDGLAVHHRVHRLWRGTERQDVLDLIVEVIEEAIATAPEADAVGFGIPSLMDRDRAVSLACVHLPLDGVPFRDLISERLDRPVVVDNDANCALLAEARAGAAKGAADALLLTLGTGIGGGILARGELYRGARARGRARAHGGRARRRAVPVRLAAAASRRSRRAPRSRARARRPRRREPDSALGRAPAGGPRDHGRAGNRTGWGGRCRGASRCSPRRAASSARAWRVSRTRSAPR